MSTRTFFSYVCCLVLLASVLIDARSAALAAPVFADDLVATVSQPTALAFTPDGRILITSQGGQLQVVKDGTLLSNAALDLAGKLCNVSERGLLGVAVDPNFAANRYIYLYYTFNKHNACPTSEPGNTNNPVNRIVRYVLPDSNQIDPSTEFVLIDNIISPNGNHNGGDLHFGKDGLLYISVGDGGADYANDSGGGGANDAARDQFILLGKILRINADGSIPSTNPYLETGARCNVDGRNTQNKPCQETFASGLRNPFRLAFDANSSTTRFRINDVGQNAWEEIDEGQKGIDYGWNCREGKHPNPQSSGKCNPAPANLVDPIYDYPHTNTGLFNGCNSITGGAFVPRGIWPGYDGAYVFSDYTCGKIFRLNEPQGGAVTASELLTDVNGPTALAFNPYDANQGMYYTSYGSGQVRRLRLDVLAARVTATPTSGKAPLSVAFDGSASSVAPSGPAIEQYLWDFGDGTIIETPAATTTHTYTSSGQFTASLRVRDANSTSDPVVIKITVGVPPVPKIIAPTPAAKFGVGESFMLQGSATDSSGATLPASALKWNVLLHHDNHTHPFLSSVAGATAVITAPAPEDLLAARTSYLELQLTATDANGVTAMVTQTLQPQKVDLTFKTTPANLALSVNGQQFSAQTVITSWKGYELTLVAPTQPRSPSWLRFAQWSQGGAAVQKLATPAAATTYTATFTTTAVLGVPLISR